MKHENGELMLLKRTEITNKKTGETFKIAHNVGIKDDGDFETAFDNWTKTEKENRTNASAAAFLRKVFPNNIVHTEEELLNHGRMATPKECDDFVRGIFNPESKQTDKKVLTVTTSLNQTTGKKMVIVHDLDTDGGHTNFKKALQAWAKSTKDYTTKTFVEYLNKNFPTNIAFRFKDAHKYMSGDALERFVSQHKERKEKA